MKKNTAIAKITLLPLLFLLLALPAAPVLGAMTDYCVSPPFLAQPISPNILIVLDSSGSMCGQAYPGSYDPSQFANGLYYGYFDGAQNYIYNGSRWEITAAAMNTGTNANPIATGSFLNWATMRRIEAAKKLLVGGKGNPRSPSPGNTVKLDAQTDCSTNTTFDKDFVTTNQIFPFVGNYRFQNDDGVFKIIPLDAGSISTLRPISDITPTPAGWSESPVSGAVVMYTKVAEASSDGDSTYIQNNSTTNPVIMGFNYAGAEPAGSISVTVKVRAKKTASGGTREIHNVLRIDGVDYESPAMDLKNSYDTYSWTLANNPAGGAAWTWSQIKKAAVSGNLNGFGVKAKEAYTSKFVRVTQVYLEVGIPLPTGGTYNIIVDQGGVKAEGIIDNLDDEVRFGLAYYNASNGGIVNTYVGYNSPTNMITSIENMTPDGWTPLGEALHEMVRYFRQDDPYYSNSPADYSPGAGAFTSNTYRDPYAYKFTDVDAALTDQYVPCAKSFILFLTDGESTQDLSMPGTSTTAPYAPCTLDNLKACSGYGGAPNNPNPRFAGTPVGQTYSSSGTDYMIDVAYWARTNDMRPGAETDVPTTWRKSLPGTQNVFLYPVYMFGSGSSLLKDAAIYGGFVDINGNNKPDCTTIPAECYKDSNNSGTVTADGLDLPLTYYEGNDGYALEQNLKQAIYDMLKRAASSTAVSVLSSSEGSGATLVQSLFYPNRSFASSADITWTSDLMNYWYYLDPYFTSSQIREDIIRDDSTYTLLDLKTDYITQFYFDLGQQKTLAARCQDTDGDGDCDTDKGTVPIEDAKAIWRAGVNLWWTLPSARAIKTSIDGSSLISFDSTNRAALDDYLGQLASASAANATISYVRGDDCVDTNGAACVCGTAGCLDKLCLDSRKPCSTDADCGVGDPCVQPRNRIATLKVCSTSRMACNTDADCTGGGGTCAEETHIWKLGDIVSSTPRIMGPSPSNNFHVASPFGYGDQTYKTFVTSFDYKDRQRVFVGSNDGMFHAFRLGKVLQRWPGKHWYEAGRLEGAAGIDGIGTESWAFVPKNVLPYLQYLSKPDYCHIYMADGPVVMTDASIHQNTLTCSADYWDCPKQTTAPNSLLDLANTSWRSIVIGSMGIGGATSSGVDAACVKTPLTVDGSSVGWSSYFALDVTEQDDPTLLWEFSNAELGVTNVGPAIVRAGGNVKRCTNTNLPCATATDCAAGPPAPQCEKTNGRWFAILASGSTGPITAKDFKGTSNKNLRLFVLDLKTGALLRTIDTGITNAFAGSISIGTVDLEKDRPGNDGNYQDDVVYIGYVKDTTSGGVLRLVINDDINPANWTVSKVIENIGPVTTSVANLIDRRDGKLWLYFGEGRYFHKQDDLATQRKLFGIQEPCFVGTTNSIDPTCTNTLTLLDLKDQTTAPSTALTAAQKGWYIKLDAAVSPMGSERVISNPTPDPLGAVYFLSFAPTSDICSFGGNTYLWALNYKTGGRVTFIMQGKALVQVSTGEIKELSLSDPTVLSQRENRRSAGFKGIPPAGQGLMVVTNPPPIKKFMHIQER